MYWTCSLFYAQPHGFRHNCWWSGWTQKRPNQHARRSAEAADLSSQITRETFENEAKRSKALAYWLLYRIHNLFLARGSLALEELNNLSPVQEFLHVYGHTLSVDDREHVRIALNGIELLIAHGGIDPDKYEKVRAHVRDAAMALREEWM
jgi:hypothetical protein